MPTAPEQGLTGRMAHNRGRNALVALACAGLLSCGPVAEQASDPSANKKMSHRYRIDRVRNNLIRTDLTTGQMWVAPHTGAGGWRTAGDMLAVEAQAKPGAGPGFTVLPLDAKRIQALGSARHVLRANRQTGDGWIGKVSADPNWLYIRDASPAGIEAGISGADPSSGAEMEAIPVISAEKMASVKDGFSDESIEALVAAIGREGLPVELRIWATSQMGEFSPDIAVPPLLEALKSDEPRVVVAAIASLRKSGVASTIPSILKLKDHPDPRVRRAVSNEIVDGS